MSTDLYSMLRFALLIGAVSCFIGRAVIGQRIGLFLLGERDMIIGSLTRNSSTSLDQMNERRANLSDARTRAFAPGSDMDPDLRRLFVRERWLRRGAWVCSAALLASLVFLPAS